MPENTTLSAKQRFELALLCEEYEGTVAAADVREESIPELVALVRYVAAEAIVWDHFNERDRRALHAGWVAARMLHRRASYEPDTFEYDVLAYAGAVPKLHTHYLGDWS